MGNQDLQRRERQGIAEYCHHRSAISGMKSRVIYFPERLWAWSVIDSLLKYWEDLILRII